MPSSPLILFALRHPEAASAIRESASALAVDAMRLETAGDGREAARLLRQNEVDLVVTVLPLPFGYELLSALLASHRTVPRVTCTWDVETPVTDWGRRAGEFVRRLRPPYAASVAEGSALRSLGLRPASSPDLSAVSLGAFIDLARANNMTCTLRVHPPAGQGSREGILYFERGSLEDARLDGVSGKGQLERMLAWPDPAYTVHEGCLVLPQSAPPPPPPPAKALTLRERLAMETVDYTPVDYERPAPPPPAALPPPPPLQPPASQLSFAELLDDGMNSFRKGDYAAAIDLWKLARQLDAENKMLTYNLKLAERKLAGSR